MSGHPRPDQIEDLVLGFADDEEHRAHVDGCGDCADRARRIEAERALLQEGLAVPMSDRLPGRILDACATPRRSWTARIPLAAAAALFLALTAVLVLRNPTAPPADYVLADGSRITLAPQAEAFMPGAGLVDLRRGAATIRMPGTSQALTVATPLGTITARGAEFMVDLRRPADTKGDAPMETLMALVVSVLAGDVQVDVAGATTLLKAGETRTFAAAQDNDDGEKGQKGKNEKGKQNDKDDGDKEDGKKKEKKGEKGDKEEEGKKKEKKKDKKEDD